MPREANGNEITVHTVELHPQPCEFQRVVQMFTKTVKSVAVKKLERISKSPALQGVSAEETENGQRQWRQQ